MGTEARPLHSISPEQRARRLAQLHENEIDLEAAYNDVVAEMHGNVRNSHCLACGQAWPTETVLEWVEAGEEDPHCPTCSGLVKTDTVLFGQMLPEREQRKAGLFLLQSDAVLVVGSTVSVWPAAVPLSGFIAPSSQKLAFSPPPRSSLPRRPRRLLCRPPWAAGSRRSA